MKNIQYDYTFMLSEYVKDAGVQANEIVEFTDTLLQIRSQQFSSPSIHGFMELPFELQTLATVKELADSVRASFSTLLVLGIGGSDLGARAIYSALPSSGMKLLFLGSNTDPHEIDSVLTSIDWQTTAVNVISKSGDTIETMSTFLIVRDRLIASLGAEEACTHIIATTDAHKGTLRAIALKEKYQILEVPETVGGRFSVLSTVGLFPLSCAGVSIEHLLEGARSLVNSLISHSTTELHATELFALFHYLGFIRRKQNINVLIPYSERLRQTGFWFRQLWAESLGKRDTLDNSVVFTGPTPVAALGSTDQHSQFQLYYFGPYDKIITFIDVENHGVEIEVPSAFSDIEGVGYMGGLKMSSIIRTELQASSLALAERGRPNGRLILPAITEHTIGQLFQFLEISTVYFGYLLNINPFDQPGVELGKQNMYALFDRVGYEDRKKELKSLLENYAKNVV